MKITKAQLKQVIKEELEAVLNENVGRPVLAIFTLKKPEPKIPGADVGDIVVLNKKIKGTDGKEYARYSVYKEGQKVRYKSAGGEKVETIPNITTAAYPFLNSGISGEAYVVELEKLDQHSGQNV